MFHKAAYLFAHLYREIFERTLGFEVELRFLCYLNFSGTPFSISSLSFRELSSAVGRCAGRGCALISQLANAASLNDPTLHFGNKGQCCSYSSQVCAITEKLLKPQQQFIISHSYHTKQNGKTVSFIMTRRIKSVVKVNVCYCAQ